MVAIGRRDEVDLESGSHGPVSVRESDRDRVDSVGVTGGLVGDEGDRRVWQETGLSISPFLVFSSDRVARRRDTRMYDAKSNDDTYLVDELNGEAGGIRADGLPGDSLRATARLPDSVFSRHLDTDGLRNGSKGESDNSRLEHCV